MARIGIASPFVRALTHAAQARSWGRSSERLHAIWQAATRQDAETAFDRFVELYHAKYDKASTCLKKDGAVLLAFYDFPAEHWIHLL